MLAQLSQRGQRVPALPLIDHILAHPSLINRPIVVTVWGVRLCRPPERLRDILPLARPGE
ncbi:MAG: hypothetical protein NTZ79_17410 [Proteobacteria bacterium]|nr:hypothetical protein [Pseudomonadota bacterium]